MNQLALNLTMNSLEISELVESRHDKVKQSIERLADREVIALPPMGDVPFVDASGRNRQTSAYLFRGDQGRRDSTIVVAQMSPEFTARLVDRWQELEQGAAAPRIPKTYAEALQLAADQARQIEHQQQQIEAAKPAVEFTERVTASEDTHTIDEAAKILRAGPHKLRKWMRANKMLRIDNTPYQELMNRGYFRVIEKPIDIGGWTKLHAQTLVTGKGMTWLQARLDTLGDRKEIAPA